MAKRSQRRIVRYEKDRAGCMWGFISLFDFRQGRSSRKLLLSERRRPSRQDDGVGCSKSKLEFLTNSNEGGEERETVIADASKTSVKELMEEEMFSEQVISADQETKKSDSEPRGSMKKNRKRARRTSKSFSDMGFDLNAAEKLGPENPCRQDLEEKSSKSLDVKNLDLDENLVEAIKLFVDERVMDGKNRTEDWRIDKCKEIINALQTTSSSKDSILELLKDPNSLLVKYIEDLDSAQLEKGLNSNLLDGERNNSKTSLPVAHKQRNFFRRRSKSQESIILKGDENCLTSSRIVILKPLPAGEKLGTERKLSSSLQSDNGLETKVQTERIASQFSFTEIKRRLKHAMGKEQKQNLVNSDKGIGGEKGGWNSPNRNHFYNERFAKPSIGIKNKNKNSMPKDTETSMGNGILEYPEKRASNIYIEAKKHLLEMLSNGDESEDFSNRQLPKTLGRILSLPEFNFSPLCSPGTDKEHGFVTAQQRLSPYKSFHLVNEDTSRLKQENHLYKSSQNLNSQSCIVDDSKEKVRSRDSNSDVLDELSCTNSKEHTLSYMSPEKSSEGGTEIEQTASALVQEESKVLEISDEQCTSSVIRCDQGIDLVEVCGEEESVQCLKLDSLEQDQLPSSPSSTSPPSLSLSKHVEDLDSTNERPERPSPVSVLEPLFTEDDISPASIKSQPVELPMQPLRINFEGHFSSSTSQESCARACVEEEESAFEYVEAVLLASDLNWEEFLLRWLSSDQVLDQSLFDELELFSNRSLHEQKLLFDCTNQVLEEVCERYFGFSPWVSFAKHNIRPIPKRKDLLCEVWEGVEWNLLSHPSPSTMDQILRKDMEKPGAWMDLRTDVESIGAEIGLAIFEELMEDTILSLSEGPETWIEIE